MVFTSLEFVIFFPLVMGLYFLIPFRWRWALLLVASYYFYMAWKPGYAILMLTSTMVDYSIGLLLGWANDDYVRKWIIASSVVVNLAFLLYFKYYNFFSVELDQLCHFFKLPFTLPPSGFLLPVGISFYTFQSMSYTIDVYRRQQEPERHFGIFALYVSFFPQLVAGPIERGTHLIPQFNKLRNVQFKDELAFDYDRAVSGFRLMLVGFIKKMVLADNLAVFVDSVYASPDTFSGCSAVLATFCFAFQIFFDFSAYTDIARGSARVLGFDIMENFREPYFSKTVPEFWRRWHISLSTWFRDYLYIPLGGNRVFPARRFFNLWTVFILCGLWHGANWTFLVWGFLHGCYYFLTHWLSGPCEHFAESIRLNRLAVLKKTIQVGLTFTLVCISWIFFRAADLEESIIIFNKCLHAPAELWAFFTQAQGYDASLFGRFTGLTWILFPNGQNRLYLGIVYTMLCLMAYLVVVLRTRRASPGPAFASLPGWCRWGCYYAGLLLVLFVGQVGARQFLYFQF